MAKQPAEKPAEQSASEICRRIAELRLKAAGPRGKSSFAKQLGISPSTYDYYEHSRTPSAEMLVRIAEVTGADLHWLLTGELGTAALRVEDHPVLRRAASLLADCPDVAGPLAAFVDLLIEARKLPAKEQDVKSAEDDAARGLVAAGRVPLVSQTPDAKVARHRAAPAAPVTPAAVAAEVAEAGPKTWIPILGRTAAGVVRFWGKCEDVSGLTTLANLVARCAGQTPQDVRLAVATDAGADTQPGARAEAQSPVSVQLVTLSAPDEQDAVEFVAAAEIKRRHPDAFALRADGDSMAPQILQGDVVVLSPSAPAVEGRAAVVQAAGQIGVTCKLYHKLGGHVHLVPVNSRYEITDMSAGQVEWAFRVLARVRTAGAASKKGNR